MGALEVVKKNSVLKTRLLQALRHWLSTRWLCWGVGPVVALWLGTISPIIFLEIAWKRRWVPRGSMIEYSRDQGASREDKIKATQDRVPFQAQLRGALYTIVGPPVWANAVLSCFLLPLVVPGSPGRLIPSAASFFRKILGMYVVGDFGLYWGHRVQHEVETLWKKCHSIHHTVDTPTPLSTAYIDPIDATLQAGLPLILAAALMQPDPLTFYATIVIRTFENVLNHSGIDDRWLNLLTLKCLPLRAGIAHHDYHHKFSNYGGSAKNFGESFWIWDWLFGTLSKSKCRA